jgi:beta-phosphoglucomutase-like phosphatase (HAD superfamily)
MESEAPQYKVWFDEKENIGRVYITGSVYEELTYKIIKEAHRITEEKGNDLRWLAKLENVDYRMVASIRERKGIAEVVKVLDKGKIALVGASAPIRVILKFILAAAGYNKDVKFFGTEEEALKWLKEA